MDLQALRTLPTEALLVPLLLQLLVILAVARISGMLVRRIGQPVVVGEILAGILLGPSFLGWVAPDVFQFLFHPTVAGIDRTTATVVVNKVMEAIKELGLLFLLFLIGLELNLSRLKGSGRTAVAVMAAGIVLPFGSGLLLGPLLPGASTEFFGTTHLFLGTVLSVTALPVLGRILVELGIQQTRIAGVVLAASAAGDVVGWVLLAGVAAMARSTPATGLDPAALVSAAGPTAGLLVALVFFVRPVLGPVFERSVLNAGGKLSAGAFAATVVLLLLSALATMTSGLFAILGAFLLGAALSERTAYRDAATERMHPFVAGFFLPVFFASTGLHMDISALGGAGPWGTILVILMVAVTTKFLAAGFAARWTGFGWKEAALIGILMNTRGVMALVAVNVGRTLGVLSPSLHDALVVMALVTTAMTTPLVIWLRMGTELEEPIRNSGFIRD